MARRPSRKRKAAAQGKQVEPTDHSAATAAPQGELAAQVSRFDLGPQGKVLSDALGPPPPGYHLTIVRGWIRAPGAVVAVWDINDAKALAQLESVGWECFRLRVLDAADQVLAEHRPARRSGTYHVALDSHPRAVRLVIGIEREDGFFQTLARSGWVRMPPSPEFRREGPVQTAHLDPDLDRRALLAAEPPPRPGHDPGTGRLGPGVRLGGRLGVAARAADDPGDRRRAAAALERTPEDHHRAPATGVAEGAPPPDAAGGSPVSTDPHHQRLEPGESTPTSPRKWGPTSPAGPYSRPESGG